MPFVKRDAQGRIASVHRDRESPDLQELPENHPELLSFLLPTNERRGQLQQSELEMIRVYEDLIYMLIRKRVIMVTDFPTAGQQKLARRNRNDLI